MFGSYVAIDEDLCEQAWANDFTGVHRNDSSTTVRMLKEMMASLNADNLEAGSGEGSDDLLPRQPGQTAHDATLIV